MRSGLLGFFLFNDTATTEIYTLSLHDALPICARSRAQPVAADARRHEHVCGRGGLGGGSRAGSFGAPRRRALRGERLDRKSTRLNSSHANISYAVFCLKKKHDVSDHPLVVD